MYYIVPTSTCSIYMSPGLSRSREDTNVGEVFRLKFLIDENSIHPSSPVHEIISYTGPNAHIIISYIKIYYTGT